MLRSPLIAVCIALTGTPSLAAQECDIPVLRQGPRGFSLQLERVPEGESAVLLREGAERVVTAVLPQGSGLAGDVVRGSESSALVLRCDPGRLRVLVAGPGGGDAREVMSADRDAFDRYEVRVNAVRGDGAEAVFVVRGGVIEPIDGPALDMFQGRVPLEPGDVAVTTETREVVSPATPLEGTVALGSLGPYLSVPVGLPGGGRARFILDLAATRSLIRRDLLPAGTRVRELVATERSAGGTRRIGGAAEGAGGRAEDIGVVATVDWLALGDLRIERFEPLVWDRPLRIAGEEVDGVLGLDVLRRADRIYAAFGAGSEGAGALRLGGPQLERAREFRLREVRGLLFLEGRLGDLPVLGLLDTGARLSVIPAELAEREEWPVGTEDIDALRGVDMRPLPVRPILAPPLSLGSYRPPPSDFVSGPFPAVQNLGLRADVVVLGQPFWRAVGPVEIDFRRRILRLPRP